MHPNPGPVLPYCFQLKPGFTRLEVCIHNSLVRHDVIGDGHCGFYAIGLRTGRISLPHSPSIPPPVNSHAKAVVRALRETLARATLCTSQFATAFAAANNLTPEARIATAAAYIQAGQNDSWGCSSSGGGWLLNWDCRLLAVALATPIIVLDGSIDHLTNTQTFQVYSPVPLLHHFRDPDSPEGGKNLPTSVANRYLQAIYAALPWAGHPIILSFEGNCHWVPLVPVSAYPRPPPMAAPRGPPKRKDPPPRPAASCPAKPPLLTNEPCASLQGAAPQHHGYNLRSSATRACPNNKPVPARYSTAHSGDVPARRQPAGPLPNKRQRARIMKRAILAKQAAQQRARIYGKRPDGRSVRRGDPHVSPHRPANLERSGAVPRDYPMTPDTPSAYPFPGPPHLPSPPPSPGGPSSPAPPPRSQPSQRCPRLTDASASAFTLLALNICKGGRSSPSLGDLISLIELHRPDVVCLSETPFVEHSRALTTLLRKLGYLTVYRPRPTPKDAIKSRYPSNRTTLPPGATGGVLCAVDSRGPYGHAFSPLTLPDTRFSSHVTGVLLTPLVGRPRLVVSVYLPHCQDLYQATLDFLSSLPALHPEADVTIAGDFQAAWEGPSRKSLLLQELLAPMFAPASPSSEPTFCPAHAPDIATTIDHVLHLQNDPLLCPSAHTLTRLLTGFTDHKALLLHCPNSGMTFLPAQQARPDKARPATLKRPIPAGPLEAWAAAECPLQAVALARLEVTLTSLRRDSETHPAPHDDPLLCERAEAASTALQQVLSLALGRALDSLPQIASKPPQHRSDTPFWSRKYAKPHRTCHVRSRIVRKLIHHVAAVPPTEPSRLIWDVRTSALYDSLLSHSLPPDALHFDALSPPSLDELTPASLQALHATHKKQAAWYAHAAGEEAGEDYAEYLTALYNHKPKQALNLILRCYADEGPQRKLLAVRDAAGVLHTSPEAVVSAVHSLATASLEKVPPPVPPPCFPWEDPSNLHSFKLSAKGPGDPILLPALTPELYHSCLSRLAPNKATGPDGVPAELLQRMPPAFHAALLHLFQCMTILGYTPSTWLHSTTVLLYKKGDATDLLNYRPISLANSLYKLWTGLLTEVATDYAETHLLLSDAQEGFRKGKSCARAIAHLQLAFEDAKASGMDCYTTYIDFKGAYPSVDHAQLGDILVALGMPSDFVRIVRNLYASATTSFLTPHGATPSVPIHRGTLQGDPLSPLLFDLMIEPLIQWLARDQMGFVPEGTKSPYSSQVYADDVTLCTPTVAAMQLQLRKVELFSAWSNIHPNVKKCAITAFCHSHKHLPKLQRDAALNDMLCVVRLAGSRLPVMAQDEPLPCNYLGTAITADLSPQPQRRLALHTIRKACGAIQRCPLPSLTKVRALAFMTGSKLRHTHGLALYDVAAISTLDSAIAGALRKALPLSCGMPTAAIQGPKPQVGMDYSSLMADYAATASQVALDVLNDMGPLGALARASMARGAPQYTHWPLALALSTNDSLACRWLALAKLASISLSDTPPCWLGNSISDSLERMLYMPPSLAYPPPEPEFPPIFQVLTALIPLWRAGLTAWDDVLCPPRPAPEVPRTGPQAPEIMTISDLLRSRPDLEACPGLPGAMRYLAALLTSTSLKDFTHLRARQAAKGLFPSLRVAARWIQGLQLQAIPAP